MQNDQSDNNIVWIQNVWQTVDCASDTVDKFNIIILVWPFPST